MKLIPRRSADPADAGLSLIEVIVALTLIGVIAAAAATFFISSMATNKNLRTEQIAATVANQALDAARSVSPRPPSTNDVSGLLKGRSQSEVEAAFAAAKPEDVSDLDTASMWDPNGNSGTSDDWVPLSYETNIGNSNFQVTTLIGACYRPQDYRSPSQDCTVARSAASDISIFRIRAVVSWYEKGCEAGSRGCTYRASALIDPSDDAYWNTNIRPYPVDDIMEVSAGDAEPTPQAVIGNDDLDVLSLTPGFQPVIQPEADVAAEHGVVALPVPGIMSYRPTDDDYSGTDEFSYRLINSQGAPSLNYATVRVRILPAPRDDEFRVATAGETLIDVFDNDLGKFNGQGLDKKLYLSMSPTLDLLDPEPSPELVAERAADRDQLAQWGIRADGTDVYITPPASANEGDIVDFYYYLADHIPVVDGPDEVYASRERARVRVMVGDCMDISNIDFNLTMDQTGWNTLDVNGENGNRASCTFRFTGVEWAPGGTPRPDLQLDGSPWEGNHHSDKMGSELRVRFQHDQPNMVTLRYVMVSGSFESEEREITVYFRPIANDDAYDVQVGDNQFRLNGGMGSTNGKLRNNDYPDSGAGSQVRIQVVSALNCGSFRDDSYVGGGSTYLNNDNVVYQAPNRSRTCRFSYKLVPVNAQLEALGLSSNAATVIFQVGNPTIHSLVDSVWSNYPQTPNIANSAIERVESITDTAQSTKWFVGLNQFSPNGSFPIHAIYSLEQPATLNRYSITSANDFQGRDPSAWRVYGSNSAAAATNPNHNSWQEIHIRTAGNHWTGRHQKLEFNVTNPGEYQYYRLSVSSVRTGSTEFQIADWTLEN